MEVARGKLVSSGDGRGGIAASDGTSGRKDVGGSGGGISTSDVEGKVGSAGSGGGGISLVTGTSSSVLSESDGVMAPMDGSCLTGSSVGDCGPCTKSA